MTTETKVNNAQRIAKRMFWLAWQACGGTFGMGDFQDRAGASEEDVWANVMASGDYPGRHARHDGPLNPYGDYVFGRMMKLGFAIDGDTIILPTSTPQLDYQAWCGKYANYQALQDAAVADLAKATQP